MSTLAPDRLGEKIAQIAAKPRSVLFAGAGISARVGVPAWSDLLLGLGNVCTEHGDKTSAQLITEKVSDGDFLGAATIYKACNKIPLGERNRRLITLLSPPMPPEALEKLGPLLELGFGAAVTTNFDLVLPRAYSHCLRKFPRCLELDDDSLKAGPMLGEFYIARIHGRMEKPEDLIFDTNGYAKILEHPQYLDFLLALLTQRPCCFLGFSFYDPAIAQILHIYAKKHGPNFPQLHLAIIPNSASSDLGRKLHEVNIEVATYDPVNGHHDLWHALRLASHQKALSSQTNVPADVSIDSNFPRFKRFAAFSYAQLSTRSQQAPLIDTSKRAIALSLIEAAGSKGKLDEEYHKDVADLLHVGLPSAREFFVDAAAALVASGFVERKHGKLVLLKKLPNLLDEKLTELADSLIDRARVLAGVRIPIKDKAGIIVVIEKVFLARAWDLAAYYAGAKIGYPADITNTIEAILADENARRNVSAIGALRLALLDLLQRPTDEESKVLTEIGRSAFAVQIIFSSPRQVSHARFLLPTRIYFDSNFVMPAIVIGHPMQSLYSTILNRLLDAAKKSKTQLELVVGYQFANEIIAHRELAISTVTQLGLEDPKRLRQHITTLGAHNGNVFVSAYASEIGRAERKVRFADFLKRAAPYRNEKELKSFLEGLGFRVDVQDPKKLPAFEKTKTLLEIGYRRGDLGIWGTKKSVLVTHEAAQMAALMFELDRGLHSLFVTADLRLANVIYTDNYLKKLSGAIMSGFGFIGMVDLLLGVRVDNQSFARLVWASPVTSDEVRLRDFLLQRALAEYDAALLKKMPEIIDQTVSATHAEVERRGIVLSETSNIEELSKSHDLLDRMENQFFQKMREAMDQNEK